MRASYGFCMLVALFLAAIAWLLSLLLADNLFDEAFTDVDPLTVMLDIEDVLNSEPASQGLINELENNYGVLIEAGDKDESVRAETAESVEYFESYDLVLDDGRALTVVFPFEDTSFFTPGEWLHLALQSLAALAAVGVTILIMNNRLKILDGATRAAQFSELSHQSSDPIEKAVAALNYAKQNIMQLSESQKSAATDHRDLLASVAHEFRNPLARLQFANEMAMERTGDEQKALFEEANTAAVELDELVRETLRYSRISSFDNALTIEYLSVEDLFRDISENSFVSKNNIMLRIQYPEQEYFIHADRRLFTRALVNLIDNGFRYASTTVTLEVREEASAYVFLVQDDGEGIAAIHHDKLFEPFYRVERSRSRDTGGFGLGLSIVKSVCDRHNATVTVTNEENGACFAIRFPISNGEHASVDG